MIACLLLLTLASSSPAQGQVLTIVALGDSTTAGTPYFLSPLEAPPEGKGNPEGQYTHWMMQRHPKWRVLNRGVNGQRSDEIRARFGEDVIRNKPRYVVILAGVNDVYQGYPQEYIRKNLLAMYRQAKAEGIVPIAASVLPFSAAMAKQSREIRALNRWIRAQAQKERIPFCDLHQAAADPDNADRLKGSPDGLHPDIQTYRILGETVARLINNLEAAKAVDHAQKK